MRGAKKAQVGSRGDEPTLRQLCFNPRWLPLIDSHPRAHQDPVHSIVDGL